MQAAALKCRPFTQSPVGRVCRRPRAAGRRAATAVASKHLSTYSAFMGTRLVAPQLGVQNASAAAASSTAKQPTSMSFFGVGAPEAILVAIVSLIVFGPKGLAEAAKSIGQSLRAFKPTIKEVVEVSQDLRSTLENELGLDELRDAAKPMPRSMPKPLLNDPSSLPEVAAAQATATTAAAASSTDTATPAASAPSAAATPSTPAPAAAATPGTAAEAGTASLKAVSDSFAKTVDPQIEAKRAASAAMAWGGAPPAAAPADAAAATAAAPAAVAAAVKDASQLSLEELEAELARRRKASGP